MASLNIGLQVLLTEKRRLRLSSPLQTADPGRKRLQHPISQLVKRISVLELLCNNIWKVGDQRGREYRKKTEAKMIARGQGRLLVFAQ